MGAGGSSAGKGSSNSTVGAGGSATGLDRADDAAGKHGQKGRDNAREKNKNF